MDGVRLEDNKRCILCYNNTKILKCDYSINLSDNQIANVNTIYELENNGTRVLNLEINFE